MGEIVWRGQNKPNQSINQLVRKLFLTESSSVILCACMTYPRPLSWINTLSIDRKSADIDCTSNFIHSGLTEHRNAVCQIKAALIPVEITHRLASITLHNLPAILTRTFSLTLPFPTYISVCSILQTNFIICILHNHAVLLLFLFPN